MPKEQLAIVTHNLDVPQAYITWREQQSVSSPEHKFLEHLSIDDWNDLLDEQHRQFEPIDLVTGILREAEHVRYDKGFKLRPETKIIYIIAENLQTAQNFDGTPARRKPAEFAKASEHYELIAVLSQFIEDDPYTPQQKVYSEMADVLWNLYHLTYTDPDAQAEYKQLIELFLERAGLSATQAGLLLLVKFTTRLYENLGKNEHEIEDGQIRRLLVGIKDGNQTVSVLPELTKQRASDLYTLMQKTIKPVLFNRLELMRLLYQSADSIPHAKIEALAQQTTTETDYSI